MIQRFFFWNFFRFAYHLDELIDVGENNDLLPVLGLVKYLLYIGTTESPDKRFDVYGKH